MTRAKRKDSVEGGDATSACGEVEKIRVAVFSKATVGGLGELLLED